jgi:hypothetical protein
MDNENKTMIPARGKGRIYIPGQFSTNNRHPSYNLKISATVENNVEWKERLIGTQDKYVVVVDIKNKNDSPAFITLEIK